MSLKVISKVETANEQLKIRSEALEIEKQFRKIAELNMRLRCISNAGKRMLTRNTEASRTVFELELKKSVVRGFCGLGLVFLPNARLKNKRKSSAHSMDLFFLYWQTKRQRERVTLMLLP